ncbi:restriction endonuclease subunit S [Cupriavidus basilensis]|uniref:restriction endonuclease subunit S n=1 Tax=Cupriavidus basilensis TaxID=68895 RepID=UPI0023E7F3DA|nr:restriction endonuclease subunit S [Cupriavidus basilensis]MDF3887909.1 restriction endonuclease subunit S [Cupriavidus basilensis]
MSLVGKPGYKETTVGWIPGEWTCEKLSDFVALLTGAPFKSEFFSSDDGIPLIRIRDLLRGFSETGYIGDYDDRYLVNAGDVLVGMDGEFHVVRWKGAQAVLNQRVLKISERPGRSDESFLFFLVANAIGKIQDGISATTVKHLSTKDLQNLIVAIPPLHEQQKIAAVLTAVDDKLDVIARQIEATETLKRGLMQMLFSQGMGMPDADGRWVPHVGFKDSELGRIPASWEVRPIGSLFDVVERAVKMDETQPYRRVTVKRRFGGIELRDELPGAAIKVKNQFLVEAGDFLISERQIVHGACGVVPSALTGALVSNEYLVLRAKSETDVRYFNYMVQLLRFRKYFLLCSQGVDIEKFLFKPKDWLKKLVPVPPSEEQARIADVLALVDQKLQALEEKQSECQTLKRGLMQKLLSGEWCVKLEDAEPLAA